MCKLYMHICISICVIITIKYLMQSNIHFHTAVWSGHNCSWLEDWWLHDNMGYNLIQLHIYCWNLAELPGGTQQRWNLSLCSLTLSSPRIRWMFFGFWLWSILVCLQASLISSLKSVGPFIVCIDSFGVRHFTSRPSRMFYVNSRRLHQN